ncbi:MAG: hypothetical protein KGZ25_10360 [Planctomycetes bacterium]|nr:hypothetical protein [Planctomycetota bacterium]
MRNGRTAVLGIDAPNIKQQKSYKYVWGIVQSPKARQNFAEMVAHFARQEAELDVLPVHSSMESLQQEGLQPALNVDRARAESFARQLGCKTYMMAHVERWRFSYFFFHQKGDIQFELLGYSVGTEQPIWRAEVSHQQPGKSEREVAIEALQALFKKLDREKILRNVDIGN